MSTLGIGMPMALRVGFIARSLGCPPHHLGEMIHTALTLISNSMGVGSGQHHGGVNPHTIQEELMRTLLCSAVAAIRIPPDAAGSAADGGDDAGGPSSSSDGPGNEKPEEAHRLMQEEPVTGMCREILQVLKAQLT